MVHDANPCQWLLILIRPKPLFITSSVQFLSPSPFTLLLLNSGVGSAGDRQEQGEAGWVWLPSQVSSQVPQLQAAEEGVREEDSDHETGHHCQPRSHVSPTMNRMLADEETKVLDILSFTKVLDILSFTKV